MCAVEKGITIYQIEKNGCLNGVYTNDLVDGKIFNEIARKRGDEKDSLEGTYDCIYFEEANKEFKTTLTISEPDGNKYDVI